NKENEELKKQLQAKERENNELKLKLKELELKLKEVEINQDLKTYEEHKLNAVEESEYDESEYDDEDDDEFINGYEVKGLSGSIIDSLCGGTEKNEEKYFKNYEKEIEKAKEK